MRRDLALLLASTLLLACSGGPGPAPRPATAPASVSRAATPTPPDCATRVLSRLSEPQRVGQLLWIGLLNNQLGPDETSAIRDQHAGSVYFTELSAAPASDIKQLTDSVQALAGPDSTGGIGFLVGANQEGGQIDQLHGPGFSAIPPASVQGTMDPAELRADAEKWGRELRAAGVNFEVAPVMDTIPPGTDAQNGPIGALQRGFGHDVATVSSHGVAFIEGMHAAGEPVTVKHFPGLGRVAGNTDFAAGVVDSTTTADDEYLQPFAAGIAAGAEVVMTATATYTRIDPDHMAAFSSIITQDLLRTRMHFEGVIAADDLGAAVQVADIPAGQRAVDFIAAGGDLIDIKYPTLAAPMEQALLARAASDPAFHARIDESVLRVLRLKERDGLLPPGC